MIQCRSRLRLALKTRPRLRILRHIVGQKLERDKPAQADVFRLINHTHAPAAEFLDDPVVRNCLIDHESEMLRGAIRKSQ